MQKHAHLAPKHEEEGSFAAAIERAAAGADPTTTKGGRGCGGRADHVRAGLPEPLPGLFLHENGRFSSQRHLQKVRRAEKAFSAANSDAERPTNGLNRAR